MAGRSHTFHLGERRLHGKGSAKLVVREVPAPHWGGLMACFGVVAQPSRCLTQRLHCGSGA